MDGNKPHEQEEKPLDKSTVAMFTIFLTVYAIGLVALFIDGGFNWQYWQSTTMEGEEITATVLDRSAIFRNILLIVAAAIAIPLAVWRGIIADRQNKVSGDQYILAQQGHVVDRFLRGVEMLGKSESEIRVAGLSILRDVARVDPMQYSQTVLDIVCVFAVRESSAPRLTRDKKTPPVDLEHSLKIVPIMGKLVENIGDNDQPIRPQLQRIDLRNLHIYDLDFSFADLTDAVFSNSVFTNCNFDDSIISRGETERTLFESSFRGASIDHHDLKEAKFFNCDCTGMKLLEISKGPVSFYNCNLSDAFFYKVYLIKTKFEKTNVSNCQFFTEFEGGNPPLENAWAWENQPPISISNGGIQPSVGRLLEDKLRKEYEHMGRVGMPSGTK